MHQPLGQLGGFPYVASPYPERDERHLSLFRVGAITIGLRRELCLIRNVSDGGMQIKLYSAVEPGTRISIEFKQGDAIHGTIQWVKESAAGVMFDTPIDVKSILSTPNDARQPRMPRIAVDCAVTIRDDAMVVRARAHDISQGGIGVESLQPLRAGARVVVSIAGLDPEGAVVCWSSGGIYGLSFNRVLPVSTLVQWLHHHRPATTAKRSVNPGAGPASAGA